MKHRVKPDFEKVGITELGDVTMYGDRRHPIGSGKRSYYETELRGFMIGADKIWANHAEPLLEESNTLQAKILEFRHKLKGDNPLNYLLLQLYDEHFGITTKR